MQLAHDGLQALLVLWRHRLVGLRRGQCLLEGDADVAVRQALAEQVAVLAAVVVATGQHDDPVPAEVQQHLHHGLHLVIRTRHGAQHRREPALVAQLIVDGAVGDLPEWRSLGISRELGGAHTAKLPSSFTSLKPPSSLTLPRITCHPHRPTWPTSLNFDLTFPDFPGGSNDKAFAYNAGDPGLIPGSGRSPG